MTTFFALLIALGAATALSSLLWRRLAALLGQARPGAWVLVQPLLGGALIVAGLAGLLAVR